MNRLTQSAVMAAIGAVLLRLSLTDIHLRYVKESMVPFLIASGVLLVVVGAVTFIYDVAAMQPGKGKHRVGLADPACCDVSTTTSDKHSHDAGAGPRSAWLLVLPIAVIMLVAPQPLGSFAANRAGTATTAAATRPAADSVYPPLPEGDPVALSLLDYAARAAFERGVSLEGRRVELVGFISPQSGGKVYLARMIMVCCAADARPIKVGLKGSGLTSLKADQWVRIEGVYDPTLDTDPANGEKIPYLRVQSLQRISPPSNPFDS